MVVNPFFLHGSTQEQNLMQDLINEQLRMYGIDVYYIPREFVREATIMREVTSSEFRSYFIIEAYLNNFDGYGGQGDIMSKFGIQVKDEVTLTISRERYENYIAPFLNSRLLFQLNSGQDTSQIVHRPREGDLVYFPLGRRIFEIKYVEHEQPFYQLGKGYTYELQCELFEYEDEILDTSIDEIDSTIGEKGYITTLALVPISTRAEVSVGLGTGYIKEIEVLNEGRNFKQPAALKIEPPEVGIDPEVVAIMTTPNINTGTSAIKQLITFNSGAGYTKNPTVEVQGDGTGAIVRAGVSTSGFGIVEFTVENGGSGYAEDADIIVYDSQNNIVAQGLALTNGKSIVKASIVDPGNNLDETAFAVVSEPAGAGQGTFIFNEIVVGRQSGTRARVKAWDQTKLTLSVSNLDPDGGDVFFQPGETLVGETSDARYSIQSFDSYNTSNDGYSQNEEIQDIADVVVDTQEYNQFVTETSPDFNSDNPFGE